MKELIERLRDPNNCNVLDDVDEAADAIEQLLTENQRLKAELAQTNKLAFEDALEIEELENQVPKWIPVSERLPEPETEVLVLARCYKNHIVTTAMYEDGTKNTEDSNWWWETEGFEYDEELDAHIIPEGWWEYKHYNGDEDHNYAIDDVVTHWMPLPEPPKGE